MANITTLSFQGEYSPTNACFEWCKEQNFIHQSNLEIQGLTILVVALIALFIYMLYLNFGEMLDIEMLDITYRQRIMTEKIIQLLPEFSMYLIIGFFIWFIWFN